MGWQINEIDFQITKELMAGKYTDDDFQFGVIKAMQRYSEDEENFREELYARLENFPCQQTLMIDSMEVSMDNEERHRLSSLPMEVYAAALWVEVDYTI